MENIIYFSRHDWEVSKNAGQVLDSFRFAPTDCISNISDVSEHTLVCLRAALWQV